MNKLYGYQGRKWQCIFWNHGRCISLGISICWDNIEIHLPLGFLRVGKLSANNFRHKPGWYWGDDNEKDNT